MDLDAVTGLLQVRGALAPEDLPGWRDGDAWLGGGTWLFSEPQPHLTRLLDLTTAGWTPLHAHAGGLSIAATCTITELDRFEAADDWTAAPLFSRCCHALLGSFKVHNVATVGGNICLGLPAGPMTSLTAALDAVATVWRPGGGERRIAVLDLVTGDQRTALAPGEVLRQLDVPAAALRARTAFRQMSLTPVGRSAALLIGRLDADGSCHLTVTASTVRPMRIAFPAVPDAAELADALRSTVHDNDYHDDVHGSPAWRKHLTAMLAEDVRRELHEYGS